MKIAAKTVVHMHYTLKSANGDVIDSSQGQEPLAYIHGQGNLISGLERELEGKNAGDKLHVVVAPEDAYGIRSEDMVEEVALSDFSEPDSVEEGVQFQVETPEGARLATVIRIEGSKVTIDMNHPLADQTLYFDVDIVQVRTATEEELAHGHVHGAGGHHH